ncbi:hypothetical protein GCM10025877_23350 [Agromyces mangrovi Wang et al. 2018]|nr:hypothetical protein GCM10025877_23350 [Agromyces mangrovi]
MVLTVTMTVALAIGAAAALGVATGAGGSDPPTPLALTVASSTVALGWTCIGGVLAWMRPANAVGWMLVVVGALTQAAMTEAACAGAGWLGDAGADDYSGRPVGLALTLVGGWALLAMLGVLPAVYPEGRLPRRAWAWPVGVVVLGATLMQAQWLVVQFVPTSAGSWLDDVLGTAPIVVYLGGAGVVWILSIVRLLRAPAPRRQQLAWLLGSVVLLLLVNVSGDSVAMQVLQVATLSLLPLAIAVGLLRYRLLGIDASPGADPMRTVAELGRRVAANEEGELLGAVLATVVRSVGAPGARLLDEHGGVAATVGDLRATGFSAELAVGGVPVGTLQVATRWPGDRYTTREERMLRALAAQLAAVVRAQHLTEQVEAQRDAGARARDVERERVRHDLHDGLGPSLTGIRLGLDGAADAIRASEPARAGAIIDALRGEVTRAVEEVRRVLDDLRPAALDERGLAEGLRRSLASIAPGVDVELHAEPVDAVPLEVEQAAYRIANEAVANAVRHGGATRIVVELASDHAGLVMQVSDDGCGFDATTPGSGIGLASMHDRARRLGGSLGIRSSPDGTTVTLALPLPEPLPERVA